MKCIDWWNVDRDNVDWKNVDLSSVDLRVADEGHVDLRNVEETSGGLGRIRLKSIDWTDIDMLCRFDSGDGDSGGGDH